MDNEHLENKEHSSRGVRKVLTRLEDERDEKLDVVISTGRQVEPIDRPAAASLSLIKPRPWGERNFLPGEIHIDSKYYGEDVGLFFKTPDIPELDNHFVAITDHAHTQIAQRAKIPTAYYRRMLADQPDLLVENVATWWEAEPENRLLRTIGVGGDYSAKSGRVRAFLSSKYRTLDNYDFVQAVLEEVEKADAEIVDASLDDERLYMRLVTPIEGEISEGDVVRLGIAIRNSEVGDGSVSVQPWVDRLVCGNGMIAPTKYNRMHLGSKLDLGVLSSDTINLENQAIWSQVTDWVKYALNPDNLHEIIGRFQAAKQVRNEAPAKIAVGNIVKRHSLNGTEANSVYERFLRAAGSGEGDTQFAMVNAVTSAANGDMSMRRSSELQEVGGALLHLDGPDWQKFVGAPIAEKQLGSLFAQHAA